MFASVTATGVVGEATTFVAQISPVAMIAVGLGLAVGLTGWVISRLRRAAH